MRVFHGLSAGKTWQPPTVWTRRAPPGGTGSHSPTRPAAPRSSTRASTPTPTSRLTGPPRPRGGRTPGPRRAAGRDARPRCAGRPRSRPGRGSRGCCGAPTRRAKSTASDALQPRRRDDHAENVDRHVGRGQGVAGVEERGVAGGDHEAAVATRGRSGWITACRSPDRPDREPRVDVLAGRHHGDPLDQVRGVRRGSARPPRRWSGSARRCGAGCPGGSGPGAGG